MGRATTANAAAKPRTRARSSCSRAASSQAAAPAFDTPRSRSEQHGRRGRRARRRPQRLPLRTRPRSRCRRPPYGRCRSDLRRPFDKMASHRQDAVGDVGRRRRIAELVGHHTHLALLAGKIEHGADEIAVERAVHPRGAQDDVTGVRRRHRALAVRLGAAVGVDRSDRVAFDVRIALGAVEHVVGRQVDHRDAKRIRARCEQARCSGVDELGELVLRLRLVHIGVGGGADDDIGCDGGEGGIDRVRLGEVERRASDADDVVCCSHRPFDQRPDYLAVGAGDGDPDPRHQVAWRSIDAEAFAAVALPQRAPPPFIGDVPLHGGVEPVFETDFGGPLQLALQLARIDRVAPVVAGPVLDARDEAPVRRAAGSQPVEAVADRGGDGDVGPFARCADVVLLARSAARQDAIERARMILDMQPVADVEAIAVDRDRLALDAVQDRQRDQLLGEVIGAVIVRAVRDDGRDTIGGMPCADEMIGGRLAGGVGRVRAVGGRLDEPSFRPKRTIHFIGRDMDEAEYVGPDVAGARNVPAACLQQIERPDDVGVDERV